MAEYKMLPILFFSLIVGSKTWSHTAKEDIDKQHPGRIALGDTVENKTHFPAEGKYINGLENLYAQAIYYPHPQAYIQDIENRYRPSNPNWAHLCHVKSDTTTYPKQLVNIENRTKDIVDVEINGTRYEQGVTYETCMNTNDPEKPASERDDFKLKCIQKHVFVPLYAREPGNESNIITLDLFLVKAYCLSVYGNS